MHLREADLALATERAKRTKLETEIMSLAAEASCKSREFEAAIEAASKAACAQSRLYEELKSARERETTLEEEVRRLAQELKASQQLCAKGDQHYQEECKRSAHLEQQLQASSKTVTSHSQALERTQKELSLTKETMKEVRDKLGISEEACATSEIERKELASNLAAMASQKKELEQALAIHKVQLADTTDQLRTEQKDHIKTAHSLTQNVSELEHRLRAKQDEEAAAQETLRNRTSEHEDLSKRHTGLQTRHQELVSSAESLEKRLKQSVSHRTFLQGEIRTLKMTIESLQREIKVFQRGTQERDKCIDRLEQAHLKSQKLLEQRIQELEAKLVAAEATYEADLDAKALELEAIGLRHHNGLNGS
eukprot:scaffold3586_cov404-Prasinococcus_capsulatus_cf.AAC.24